MPVFFVILPGFFVLVLVRFHLVVSCMHTFCKLFGIKFDSRARFVHLLMRDIATNVSLLGVLLPSRLVLLIL